MSDNENEVLKRALGQGCVRASQINGLPEEDRLAQNISLTPESSLALPLKAFIN